MARIKWEYTVRSTNTTVELLNKLGDEGWELVAASDGILFFKRPNVKGMADELKKEWTQRIQKIISDMP